MAYCNDEKQAALLAERVRHARPPWCVDIVQAYVSVAVYYDIGMVECADVAAWIGTHWEDDVISRDAGRLHVIPCCYEFGLDFERISQHTGLLRDAIISLHGGCSYTIYAIGFCPGFPFLGYLHSKLAGVPRLQSPRLQVEQGSVGLTGRQTGVYTEARPGGWNIIGRTPLILVDVKDEYFPLRTGDRVQFKRIDEREFCELKGERLVSR